MADEEQAIKEMKAKAAAKQVEHTENAEMEGFTPSKDVPVEDESTTRFYLKIYSPYKLYFEGNVESVSADNLTGTFDILKGHKNFLTLLIPCEMVIRGSDQGEQKLKINRGVMHVKADRVIVFLDV